MLTEKALYVCSYNYNLEKVVQFKRIPLDTITTIQVGEYILSSLTPISRDIDQNYGFLLYYDPLRELIRLNTGSIRNQSLGDLNIGSSASLPPAEKASSSSSTDGDSSDEDDGKTFLAFKAVRYNTLGELPEEDIKSCREQVMDITHLIASACKRENDDQFLVEKSVIRLVSICAQYACDLCFIAIVSTKLRIQTVSSKRWV